MNYCTNYEFMLHTIESENKNCMLSSKYFLYYMSKNINTEPCLTKITKINNFSNFAEPQTTKPCLFCVLQWILKQAWKGQLDKTSVLFLAKHISNFHCSNVSDARSEYVAFIHMLGYNKRVLPCFPFFNDEMSKSHR